MKFKNPPVNSLSLELLTEFIISLEKLENDKTFRGIILTSKDVEDFECGCPSSQTLQAGEGVRSLLQQHMVTAASAEHPEPGAHAQKHLLPWSGACPAGGCLISLTCDYRILADNPKYLMGLNETLLGIVAPFWFKDTFVNTIGHRASEQALQLGLLFRPAEALQVGLVDQVVPEDQVLSTALSVMARWMAIPAWSFW
ncbi:Enoyl-CoA delta isomerase 1, mitochondrial, partial [Eschrichtius robustus]|nr:Enoyl-CoA delta isomerase 1, mitochondrial [Eschrichtius robustus]